MARFLTRDNLFLLRHTSPLVSQQRKPKHNNFSSAPPRHSPSADKTPNLTCYHPGVELLSSCRSTRHLFQTQAQLITCGVFRFWAARLLQRLSDSGDVYYTILLFKYIDFPGTFVLNNVIKALSSSSVPDKALVFYFELLKNGSFLPNSYTFVYLLGSCAKIEAYESGQMCHCQAVKHGVDNVLPVQNSLIYFYSCCGVVKLAKKLFDEMPERDCVTWNSVVGAYVNAGDLGGAHELFDRMPERNIVSWNIMISGYLKKGNNPGCALMLFRRMAKRRLRGDEKTFASVISSCARSARLKEGCSVHAFLIRTYSSLNTILCTALIDMYSKCRKVEFAQRVFDRMVDWNLVCWNSMILGHCIHGKPEDGLELFEKMVNDEVFFPDELTYIGVLCACARAGMLTEGRNFFSQMIHKYNIKPNFAHNWCMANLYAGVGLVQEAEDVIRNIPEDDQDFSSESHVWANLFSQTRFDTNAMLGEMIAKSLIDAEPQNFSHYRLLLNIYAVAGQWDNVAKVKEMVKERKIGRMPGCNLLDLKEIVHNYKIGPLARGNG